MPVDLPPNKKPVQSGSATWTLVFDRSLNWLAVVIGIGLCLWVMKLGV